MLTRVSSYIIITTCSLASKALIVSDSTPRTQHLHERHRGSDVSMQAVRTYEFNALHLHMAYARAKSFFIQSSRLVLPHRLIRTTNDPLVPVTTRKCLLADLLEGSEDDLVLARGIQIKKAFQKLVEIGLRVDLILKYHLQHRMPEILVRIIRFLLHRYAVHDRTLFRQNR